MNETVGDLGCESGVEYLHRHREIQHDTNTLEVCISSVLTGL